MGNRACSRLKGNPCGPLRLNTINVTMPRGSIQLTRRQGGEYGIGFGIERQSDDGSRGTLPVRGTGRSKNPDYFITSKTPWAGSQFPCPAVSRTYKSSMRLSGKSSGS